MNKQNSLTYPIIAGFLFAFIVTNVHSQPTKAVPSGTAPSTTSRDNGLRTMPRLVSPQNPVQINVANFSLDGKLLATSGFGELTQVWEVETGLLLREFRTEGNVEGLNGDSYTAIAFSPDKNWLAIAFQGTIRIYSVVTGELIKKLKANVTSGGDDDIQCVDFSKDKRLLYLDSFRYQGESKMVRYTSVANLVSGVIAKPQRGKTSAAADCFNREAAEARLKAFGGEFAEMKTDSYRLQIIGVDPQNDRIALGQSKAKSRLGFDAVRIIKLADGKELSRLQSYLTDFPTTVVWRTAVDDEAADFKVLLEQTRSRWPDLATVSPKKYAVNLEKRNNRYAAVITDEGGSTLMDFPSGKVAKHPESNVLAVSSDGRFTVGRTGAKENGLDIVDLEEGKATPILRDSRDSAASAVFSDDNNRLAVAMQGSDEIYNILLWDGKSARDPIRIRTPKWKAIESMAFSPDGKLLAAAFCGISSDADQEIWLYDAQTGTQKRQLIGHRLRAFEVVFSPKGRYVATNSVDHTARIWNADTGKELFRINEPGEHLQFSSDGKYIFSDSVLYRVPDGSEVCQFRILPDGSYAIVAPDGRFDVNNFEDLKGLHWVIPSDPFRAAPLEIFMRQYYEPGLLQRILKCNEKRAEGGSDPCDKEFKPLPPIGQINRVQPGLGKPNVSVPKEKL